jgi:NAD(P)-dependent dehydrogenase (short-subunit alcohol dehydrogenase family)
MKLELSEITAFSAAQSLCGRVDLIFLSNMAKLNKLFCWCVPQFKGMDRDERLEWLWANCRETYDAAKEGVQTNYYGTKHVIEAFLPLLQASSDGRIVNVSSDFGLLRVTYFNLVTLFQSSHRWFPIRPEYPALAKVLPYAAFQKRGAKARDE